MKAMRVSGPRACPARDLDQGAPSHPRLSERVDFATLARANDHGANLALWQNPRAAHATLDRQVHTPARALS